MTSAPEQVKGVIVNAVREVVDDAKEIGCKKEVKLIEGGTMLVVEETKYTVDEIQRRATEIGPVLDEILHDHWDHWGLNE